MRFSTVEMPREEEEHFMRCGTFPFQRCGMNTYGIQLEWG